MSSWGTVPTKKTIHPSGEADEILAIGPCNATTNLAARVETQTAKTAKIRTHKTTLRGGDRGAPLNTRPA